MPWCTTVYKFDKFYTASVTGLFLSCHQIHTLFTTTLSLALNYEMAYSQQKCSFPLEESVSVLWRSTCLELFSLRASMLLCKFYRVVWLPWLHPKSKLNLTSWRMRFSYTNILCVVTILPWQIRLNIRTCYNSCAFWLHEEERKTWLYSISIHDSDSTRKYTISEIGVCRYL